jgi:hypothetical protein
MIQISVWVNHSNECTDALHQIASLLVCVVTMHVVLNQDGPDSAAAAAD